MPKYLAVAEKVYKNIKKDDLFTNDLTALLHKPICKGFFSDIIFK